MARALALLAVFGGAWWIWRAMRPAPALDMGAGIIEADTARDAVDRLLSAGEAVGTYFMGLGTPRGIRNNNPGNLRPGSQWRGLASPSIDSGNFLVFLSPMWGIRALTMNLLNQQRKYGLNTVRKIITKYAPPSENDTARYIDLVCRATNLRPDEGIDLAANYGTLYNFVEEIIRHENGQQPYSEAQLREGIDAGLSGVQQ